MKKILLAIDGLTPDKKALHYSMQLCRQIQAELDVLQVIRLNPMGRYFSGVKEKAGSAKRYLEGAMMATAFAEAGSHETAEALMAGALRNLKKRLSESEKEGVRYHLTLKAGILRDEIIRYLTAHKDVVLTVYDAYYRKAADRVFSKNHAVVIREIQKALSIPLVVIRDS